MVPPSRVLSVLTPYIQFFRKFCQFHLPSMDGIHSLLPPLWPHPGPVHPRLVFAWTSATASSPSLCSSTHHPTLSQGARSLRTPESGQIPLSSAQNLPLVPHVKVKESRKSCWSLPCPGSARSSFFFFPAQLLKPLKLLGFQPNPQGLSSTSWSCWSSCLSQLTSHSPLLSFHHSCSAAKLCPAVCNPMDCSTPGFPVLHHLLEFAQTHVH